MQVLFGVNRFHIALFNPYDIYKILNYVQSLEALLLPDLDQIARHKTRERFKERGSKLLYQLNEGDQKEIRRPIWRFP